MAIRALARRAGCALRATRNRLCLDSSSRGIASGGGANSYLDSFGEGKNALITGAGKGIGRALVDSLAATGANVYAVSRTQSDLDEMTKQYSNGKCANRAWRLTSTGARAPAPGLVAPAD